MKLNVPTAVATVLAAVGGILNWLNTATFGLPPAWHQVVTYGLLFLASIGVTPLVGAALGTVIRNILHLTAAALTVITVAEFALVAAVTTFGLSQDVKGVVIGVVTFLAGIGLGVQPVLTAGRASAT